MTEVKNADVGKFKSFGITMGVAFLVISSILFFKHKSVVAYVIVSAVFFLIAIVIPKLLKPLYIFWMRLALVLSWVNTRLILFLLFYLIFTPIGLIIKILRIDLLDRKIDKTKGTYWKDKEKKEFGLASYERQF
ncbi:MAG: hypothetical protein COV71_04105 [Candidatus Omnitrophica bacterium CG11_big_fil_rev_8_21_14_0_20_41_12]|nr:MAG: hypothetical protein COV71_04105 [Candidatus Omnitrophica bacterium CG11_big_fil_rev_8_21_14_0_20_41_12]